MITNDKIIEIFCTTDEFSKKYEEEIENMPLLSSEGKVRRRRAASTFFPKIHHSFSSVSTTHSFLIRPTR